MEKQLEADFHYINFDLSPGTFLISFWRKQEKINFFEDINHNLTFSRCDFASLDHLRNENLSWGLARVEQNFFPLNFIFSSLTKMSNERIDDAPPSGNKLNL